MLLVSCCGCWCGVVCGMVVVVWYVGLVVQAMVHCYHHGMMLVIVIGSFELVSSTLTSLPQLVTHVLLASKSLQ